MQTFTQLLQFAIFRRKPMKTVKYYDIFVCVFMTTIKKMLLSDNTLFNEKCCLKQESLQMISVTNIKSIKIRELWKLQL